MFECPQLTTLIDDIFDQRMQTQTKEDNSTRWIELTLCHKNESLRTIMVKHHTAKHNIHIAFDFRFVIMSSTSCDISNFSFIELETVHMQNIQQGIRQHPTAHKQHPLPK